MVWWWAAAGRMRPRTPRPAARRMRPPMAAWARARGMLRWDHVDPGAALHSSATAATTTHKLPGRTQVLELTREQERTKQSQSKEKEAQNMAHAAQLNKARGRWWAAPARARAQPHGAISAWQAAATRAGGVGHASHGTSALLLKCAIPPCCACRSASKCGTRRSGP